VPKLNMLELELNYLYLQTQFGEDRCTQFRVIVVTDPQTNNARPPARHRHDRQQYTAPLSLARSVNMKINKKLSYRRQTARRICANAMARLPLPKYVTLLNLVVLCQTVRA